MGFEVRLTPRQWLYATGGVLAVGLFSFAIGQCVWAKHTRARDGRMDFMAMCQLEETFEACERKANAHHEECFFINDHPGSKTSVAHLEVQSYQQCMMLGPEGWRAAKRAAQRERAAERKDLGLPP